MAVSTEVRCLLSVGQIDCLWSKEACLTARSFSDELLVFGVFFYTHVTLNAHVQIIFLSERGDRCQGSSSG